MTAKETMRAVLDAEQTVCDLKAQRAHYMDVATHAGTPIGGCIRSGKYGEGRVETSVMRLSDLDRQIDEATRAYTAAHVRAANLIGQLRSSRARRLMTMRYLCGESWKTIQREMGYEDEKSAFRLHGGALEEMDRILQTAG